MSRPSALVVLAALTVIVGVVVYFDRGRPTTDDARRATEQLYPRLDPSRIDHLVIERGGVPVALERRGGWWLGDGTRADDAAVEAILSTLAFGQVERVVDDKLRGRSGVDSPRVHLTASGGSVPIDLRIGVEAAGRGVYVARGSELLVAERHLYEVTDLAAAQLRSRAPVLDDPAAAATLQLGTLAIERHGAGWRVIEPKPALADPNKIAALIGALSRARAASVKEAPAPSPAPGDETLAFDGKIQARIRWSDSTCGKMPQLIRADGAVLCFAEDALAPLHTSVDQLREAHLTGLTLDQIDAADFAVAGRTLSLRRAEHAWRITAPAEAAAPADDAAVRARLSALLQLRARAFGPPGSTALGHLRLAGGADEVELALAQTGREVTAQRKGEDVALLLPADTVKLLDADALLLRSRRVDTFRVDQVSAVAGDGAELKRADDKVARLLDALSDLHAESLQRRHIAAAHTIRVTAAGAAHPFTLGPRDSDGCLVGTAEPDLAFVIAPATCAVLYAPF